MRLSAANTQVSRARLRRAPSSCSSAPCPRPPTRARTGLVISQVYGGGGNAGAPVHERLHRDLQPDGLRRFASAGLSRPVRERTGTGRLRRTRPDRHGFGARRVGSTTSFRRRRSHATASRCRAGSCHRHRSRMSGTAGKVALVNTTTALGCNGWAARARRRNSRRSSTSSATALPRTSSRAPAARHHSRSTRPPRFAGDGGCTDTDVNSADFTVAAPAPRNTSSPPTIRAPTRHLPSRSTTSRRTRATPARPRSPSPSASRPPPAPAASPSTSQPRTAARPQPGDFTAKSLTGQTIAAGNTTSTVQRPRQRRHGRRAGRDLLRQRHQRHRATVADGQGQGTIVERRRSPCCGAVHADPRDPGQRRVRRDHRHRHHRGRRRRRLRGHGRPAGLLPPGPDRRRQRGHLRRHLRVHRQREPRQRRRQVVRVTGFARERFNQTTINGSNSNTRRGAGGEHRRLRHREASRRPT